MHLLNFYLYDPDHFYNLLRPNYWSQCVTKGWNIAFYASFHMSYSLLDWVEVWEIFIPKRLELLKTHHCAVCSLPSFTFLNWGQNISEVYLELFYMGQKKIFDPIIHQVYVTHSRCDFPYSVFINTWCHWWHHLWVRMSCPR